MGVYAMDAWRAGAFLRALWSQRERVNLRYGWQTYGTQWHQACRRGRILGFALRLTIGGNSTY